jgi:hypothetical protein
MVNINSATRRFERFMSSISGHYHNNCTEVRPDTGALSSEITNYPQKRDSINENNTIGRFIYDLDKKTEKFFEYKSRGK